MRTLALWVNFVFNFTFGALVPIIPLMSQDHAGVAYGSYGLAKVLFFIPAGILVDKIGGKVCILLTIILEILALAILAYLPGHAIWGRTVEGMALALGTVTLFSLYRQLSDNEEEYKSNISQIIVSTGLGFLIGPMGSYLLLANGAVFVLNCLILLNFATLIVYVFYQNQYPNESGFEIKENGSLKVSYALVAVMFITKFLQIGFHPVITHWNKVFFQFSYEVSGLVFIATGIAFMAGAVLSRRSLWFTVFPGVIVFELSFYWNNGVFYYLGLMIMSFWFGSIMADTVGKLGFSDLNKLGLRNSLWLLVSDISIFFGPIALWEIRGTEIDEIYLRGGFLLAATALTVFLYLKYKWIDEKLS